MEKQTTEQFQINVIKEKAFNTLRDYFIQLDNNNLEDAKMLRYAYFTLLDVLVVLQYDFSIATTHSEFMQRLGR